MTTTLTLIPREYNGATIRQRHHDRYIDATAMCRAFGKRWHDYYSLPTTAEFIEALSESAGIPITGKSGNCLIEYQAGRPDLGGGTWIHPHVGIHLAQWCSPALVVRGCHLSRLLSGGLRPLDYVL